MQIQTGSVLKRALLASAAGAAAAVLLGAGPASAAVDDNFSIATTEGYNCGTVDFIDYGDEVPGIGPKNDDFLWINDNCADGRGVDAWAWLTKAGTSTATSLGRVHDGNGATGAPKVWDPFPGGDVKAGDSITIKVCSASGASDPNPTYCSTASHTSVDG
jgi:hypothetical protein